ncbi:MAG: carboxylesterase family protein [Bacteroidetes bacterium]|nr:carboxylesterase family protein [Bacteroidota bacterium]
MRFLLTSSLIFLLSSLCFSQSNYCIPNRFGEATYFDTSEIAVQQNVVYGNAYNQYTKVNEDLKMDIYYPKMEVDLLPKRPFILYIHGGGFLEGDKNSGNYKCTQWAQRGYVTASVNYRMGWACATTAAAALCWCNDGAGLKIAAYEAVQDARASLRFLNTHAAEYGIDSDYFFISGESAGSITALLTAYINQTEADSFDVGLHSVLGPIDSSGNVDPQGYHLRGIINSCGALTDTSIIGAEEVLPTISFHDEKDCLVPYKKNLLLNCTGTCYSFFGAMGSSLVHQKTQSLGVCSKLYEVAGSGSHCSFPQDQLVEKSSCFLRGILCNDCQSGFSINPYDTVPCQQDLATTVTEVSSETGIASLNIYPNPSQGESVLLVFELECSQNISISFVDILGREVWRRNSLLEKGRHTIPVDVHHLSFGVNYCVLRTASGSRSTIVVRN